jgi:DNA-binding NarL/FixJ family response regulator
MVWVEGEPGIGKTALLRRFLALADEVVVLEASGDETEVALDYGVVSQLVARAPDDPVNRSFADTVASGRPRSPFWVGAELLELLGALQDRAPVIVAVDDAHWMDRPSAGALLFALRRLYANRVLALIVARPDGLDGLGPSWARLLSDPEGSRRVPLAGLGRDEVGALAGSLGFGRLASGAADRLREHTGGHPLYVKALLNELPPEALAFEQGPLPAPHSFAATVLARATKLDADSQDLLTAAAVAGGRCSAAGAGAAAGLSDPLSALGPVLASELLALVPARTPLEVAFPHPLVRAAIYDDLSPKRRRELHLAFARLTSGTESLAHRVAASEGADDALAAELVAAGEEEVSTGALTAGIEHLLAAARVAGSRPVREAALLRAVDCLGIAGDVPRAQRLREAVIACGDSPRRSFALATLTASAGHLPEALAALRSVVERPDFALQPELAGPVFSSLAMVSAYAGDGAEAIAWARRALAGADLIATVEVTAKQALALGLALTGVAAEGVALLDSLSAFRLEPEPFEGELMATRANLKASCGDLEGAVEDLTAVIRWSQAGTPLRSLPNAYGTLAEAEYRLGRWDAGLAHADVAISLAEDRDQVWELAFAHAVASFFHAGRGNRRVAAEHVAAARRAVDAAPLPVSVHYTSLAAAHLAWVDEDWDGVLAALGEGDLGERAWKLLAAEALLRLGRLDRAAEALAELDQAGRNGVLGVELCRLRGALALARERPAEARAAFAEGQALAVATASPLVQAALELEHGRFLRRTGSRRRAIAELRTARDRFEELRARPFRQQCDAELAGCGVRAQASAAHEDDELTAREHVVAQLVASGKSNREVAGELYLSTKAIEYHLANIFAKLGIRSRHQLAARLAHD